MEGMAMGRDGSRAYLELPATTRTAEKTGPDEDFATVMVEEKAFLQENTVDTTGAGDTFTAVLAARLAEGATLSDACRAANAAAGQSVTVRYVMPSLPRR